MYEKFDLENIDKTFTRFKTGAKVNATVVAILKSGILLNIGGKKDGLIPFNDFENDSIKDLKVGDNFEAIIVNTKDESGAVILSKKKADDLRMGNEVVNNLKIGDTCNVIIIDVSKYGLLSKLGSFEVFIPYNQISSKKVDNNLKNYINKQFTVVVTEIDLISKKLVASIRSYENKVKLDTETAFFQSIFENKIVTGKVVRFTDFGAFVNVNGVDCLVHNTQASYDKKSASEVFELNKDYNFKVISVDRESKKVALSYKDLQENPIKEKIKKLKIGDIVNGKVKRILPFGAIITFGDNLEGLLHVKEASHYYVKNIYEVAKVGQELKLKIIDIDLDNNKVSLSLKALQEEPEILKLTREEKL